MLYGPLKKSLRLNRTLGTAVLTYLSLQLLWTPDSLAAPLAWLTVGLSAFMGVLFIALNETGRLTLKRFAEAESLPLEKVCVMLPVVTMGFLVAQYLLTGNLWVAVLAVVPVLQAQLFGYLVLSQVLLTVALMFPFSLISLGYPHTPALAPWQWVIQLVPALVVFFHYGTFISALVKSSSSQVNWLQSLATTDGLTTLINRRQFNHQLQAEMARARRHHHALSLALFDIDDFKKVNDFYGHTMGDRILKELGALIKENIRESDTPARYGGEEFAIILPETRQAEAYDLLERIRALVERTVFCLPDNPLTITISVGVAQLNLNNHTAFELVEEADAALYEAKGQGKNRVVFGVLPTPKLKFNNESSYSF